KKQKTKNKILKPIQFYAHVNILVKQLHYFLRFFQKKYALFCRLIYFFTTLGMLFKQLKLSHQRQIFVKLSKTQIRFIHNLSFQSSVLSNASYISHDN